MEPTPPRRELGSRLERIGRRIPDPVLLFVGLWVLTFVAASLLGGHTFSTPGAGGAPIEQVIRPVYQAEHVRWIVDNALVQNWLAFGNGVLGVILVVTLAIGVAEHAGLLYAAMKQNPLIGMAAAFAGVSAGFSANLIPATPPDVIVGMNARVFAEAQQVPFVGGDGSPLNPATMNYFFMVASTFLLAAIGGWVTKRFVMPRLDGTSYSIPADLDLGEFELSEGERRGLRAALIATPLALLVLAGLALGPLAAFENESGVRVNPFVNNIILAISLFFVMVGATFGFASGRFRGLGDVVAAATKQMNTTGYIVVLTFFSYNALALLGYSGIGAYITYLGAQALLGLGVAEYPVLLLIGFVLTTALINLFVGGLNSKWLLLGPIFVPMLYQVNPQMTPDLVAAAYRVADSSTNIITPMMSYAGIVLAFMRRYRPEMGLGDMILMMLPYSAAFLVAWTGLLLGFFLLGLPLGF